MRNINICEEINTYRHPTNTHINSYKFRIDPNKKTVIIPFKKTTYCDKMNVSSLRLKEFRVGEFTLISWGCR